MAEYFYGITDKGKRRDKNEDTFFVKEILNRRFVVACVIDGVGGYQGGDIAAGIARSVIMKQLEKLSDNVIGSLQQAIVAANAKINQEKKPGDKNERMAGENTAGPANLSDPQLGLPFRIKRSFPFSTKVTARNPDRFQESPPHPVKVDESAVNKMFDH